MENIPEQIEIPQTIQFLECPIRTNLDYTEKWLIKKTKEKLIQTVSLRNSFNKKFKIS